jgi:hypothetical protein
MLKNRVLLALLVGAWLAALYALRPLDIDNPPPCQPGTVEKIFNAGPC